MRCFPLWSVAAVSSILLLLTGCGLGPVNTSPSSASLGKITGKVHGGQQPVVGARVYVLATGTTAYAGAGIAATANNASTSLLTASVLINSPLNSGVDGLGFYVTTAADGSFTVNGDYTCTVNTGVYIYVTGGNPGAGTNTAAGFLAPLGMCPATGGNLASTTPFVWINEVSTIATAYSLAGFATDATHISTGGSALAATGMANAFATTAKLLNVATGAAIVNTDATTTAPQANVNTLANILASCVNSTGVSSSQCSTLFTNTGTATTLDTATAAINLAHAPGNNVSNLYALQSGIGSPFVPKLTGQPVDFSLGINHVGSQGSTANISPLAIAADGLGNIWLINANFGGSNGFFNKTDHLTGASNLYYLPGANISSPEGLAVDINGKVWTAGVGIVAIDSSTGAVISPTGGYTGGGLTSVQCMVLDGTGQLWITNQNNALSVFNSVTGAAITSSSGYTGGGLNSPQGLAVDASGNIWVANNHSGGAVSEFSSAGVPLSGVNGFGQGASSLDHPRAIAIDAANFVWIVGQPSSAVTKINGATGAVVSGDSGYVGGGLSGPTDIAIDGAGNVWVTNYSLSGVSEFTNNGTPVTGVIGYNGSNKLSQPYSLTIDESGNIWVANKGGNITELVGIATPVTMPLQYAAANGKIASRP